ncbi:hypothetical protein HispidOSU_019564 [Sigmodon hispidus]
MGAREGTRLHPTAGLRASALTWVLSNPVSKFGGDSVPKLTECGRSSSRPPPGRAPWRALRAKDGCAEWSLCTDWQAQPGGRTEQPRSREPRRPPPGRSRPAGGLTAARRAPGGRARARARIMTRSPLAAAPSQPAGKAISHSGPQSPEALRFVPRGPGRCH